MMVWKQKIIQGKIFGHTILKHTISRAVEKKRVRWFILVRQHSLFVLVASRVVCIVIILLATPALAFASGLSSSSNYELGEAFFGAGGQLDACSSNYCSKNSVGEVAVGDAASANYQAHAGFNTDRTPYIQVTVGTTNVDLGKLSPTTTKTTTAGFSVEAYLSHGYSVTNGSPPPTNGAYTMQTPSTQTISVPGTEQFGINLVANTYPISFGANPAYAPDNTFSFGQVGPFYDTANEYKYTQGDTIADSTASSSFTIYTISYIFNISNVTPGGTYSFNHVLIATGTY
jgi:hypothetical protein